jgi:hypothetical protein
MGVLTLPIKTQVAQNKVIAYEMIQLALKAASLYIANTTNILGHYQTVLKISCIDSNSSIDTPSTPIYTVTFIETSPFSSYQPVNKAIDRLNGKLNP